MVGMATTFGSADYSTPHGGQPFHYWKKGFGFGHGRGPGNHAQDPAIPEQLRFTPNGDRAFASSPFWKRKGEIGKASGFGIGDRPELSRRPKDGGTAAPPDYGDVSKLLSKVKRNSTRSDISLKARYPTIEEKYRDLSWPECGPGPGKYNTSIETGKSSWVYPSTMPSWSCQGRGIPGGDIREQLNMPGPTNYETRGRPGENYPIKRGTLYDVTFKGRVKRRDVAGDASPGPGRYNLNGKGGTMPMHGRPLDEYGLWAKISNVRVPADVRARGTLRPGEMEGTAEGQRPPSPDSANGGKSPSGARRTLIRVESAPM